MKWKLGNLVLVLATFAVGGSPARAACPSAAPGSMIMTSSPFRCDSGCPNGAITFVLQPFPVGLFPPAIYDPGYSIGPCDVIKWSFGDGTSQSVTGSDRVTHEYANPGNYKIEAVVTNTLGSAAVPYLGGQSAVIATSPSRLSFLQSHVTVPMAGSRTGLCEACIEAHEGSTVMVSVIRGLDLSRSISAVATATARDLNFEIPLTFGSGETQKSFNLQIPNDNVYSGARYIPLRLLNPTGGTIASGGMLVILDDDPIPVFSIGPTFAVSEGDSGLKQISIPVHLTAPMGVDAYPNAFSSAIFGTNGDFYIERGPYIHAGETTGAVTASIRGNASPERDKVFEIHMTPAATNEDPEFGNTICVVTVVNDDAAFYPTEVRVVAGTAVKVTLDIGSPYPVATTAHFTSSAPYVVPNPAPVVIPPGVTKVDLFLTARAAGSALVSANLPARATRPAAITVTPSRRRAAQH